MKVYYNKSFTGVWPVGTSAVIVARDKRHAFNLLNEELSKLHMETMQFSPDYVNDFVEVSMKGPHAIIINDGDY